MDIPSHGNAEPDQFRQGSSNQRSFRIITQPKTVTDPRRNSENILERPAELDARDIPTRVNPKAAAAQEFLKVRRAIDGVAKAIRSASAQSRNSEVMRTDSGNISPGRQSLFSRVF